MSKQHHEHGYARHQTKRLVGVRVRQALAYVTALFTMAALFFPSAGDAWARPLLATAPSLGTAGSFAVLGGSTVTNTGPTIVTGDLGVSPGTAITGFPPGSVIGTIHSADAVALQAQSDVTTAYNVLAGQACDTDLTSQDLGGMTLTPGVYCFSSSAQLTGVLTLDAQGDPAAVWVFQIGSTLTTASNASVAVINGGKRCNVFWQIGSSATLGTGTEFAGNILADQSITLTTGASMFGAALARNAAVTMDNNSISKCFGPLTIALREFQATSAAGSPFGLGAGAALLLALGLTVIRRRVLASPSTTPSARQGHGSAAHLHHLVSPQSQESVMYTTSPQRTQEHLLASAEPPAICEAPAVIS